jgi:two-component system response regulator HupR/HoxA
MDKAPPKLEILVVASEEAEREELAAVLRPLFRVQSLHPSALAQRAPLVDASAALAVLNGAEPGALEALLPVRELFAGRGLVLVVRDVEDALLDEVIPRLDPVQILTHPTPAPALLLAIRRALPADAPGEGARLGQRRARALLGVSASIREVLQQVRKVAPLQVPVLILGETGTGKELVARAIHEESSRAHRPFVAVNCSAMPDTLLESELFGFRRGAFTGADRSMRGLFQQANGGTLFLDEIGDTSPALQAKLLRAIEQQEVRPVGAEETVQVDVRIVSATHHDLEAEVARGGFRQDLFYRMNTVTIYVPPLRRHALAEREFPGNVRELRNAVERVIAMACPGETVSAKELPALERAAAPAHQPGQGTLRERIEQVESEAIEEALNRFDGNRTRAAEALGISRVGLRQKMRRLGLETGSRR